MLLDDGPPLLQNDGFDHSSSEELLQRWRTCIEPSNDGEGGGSDGENACESSSNEDIILNR